MTASPIHTLGKYAWFAGLLLVAFSLPLWNLGMSLGQFTMAGGWLLADRLPERIRKAVRQPVFWLVTGLFLIHIIGLWNTEDFKYAFRDLRIKLPLLLMPVLFAAGPEITGTQYRNIFVALLTGVLVSTGTGYAIRLGITGTGVGDYRDYSPFISHIRLSLLIDFCIAWLITGPFLRERKNIVLHLLLISWLLGYLLLIQSITGLLILALLMPIWLIGKYRSRPGRKLRIAIIVVTVAILTGGGLLYKHIFVDAIRYVAFHPYPSSQKTVRGSAYENNFARQDLEAGKLVWENYCTGELNDALVARTGKSIWDKDQKGQMLQVTLLRYLTAKDYSKDYEGVMQLKDEEVRDILNGIPTPSHRKGHDYPWQRLNDLAMEYRIWHYSGWANGQSMVMRFVYAKTALRIIAEHPYSGAGTGDLPAAWKQMYATTNTQLEEKWQLRAHNQYLSFGVAFGIGGIIYLIGVLGYLFAEAWKRRDLMFTIFLVIASVSFLGEDTLETQAGVTFFAFICGWLWRSDQNQ